MIKKVKSEIVKITESDVLDYLTVEIKCSLGEAKEINRFIPLIQISAINIVDKLEVICPQQIEKKIAAYKIWSNMVDESYNAYRDLICHGVDANVARSVLPECTAIVYMGIIRKSTIIPPTIPLYEEFKNKIGDYNVR